MAELLACRRAADPVGSDTACQHEVMAQSNVAAPASAQITPHAANAPLVEGTVDAGAALREGGATTGGPNLLPFAEIWAVDFEFGSEPGDNPEPACLVAWELRSGRKLRLWSDEFGAAPPYPTSSDVLFVAYYASAEIGCHLTLGWPVPERLLDLFTEFRNHTNGISTVSGASLLGALAHYGLDSIGTIEKDEMRDLVLRGGPWSDAEQAAILDYCESDVAALARLLPAMLPNIDFPRALLRGRYMVALARMERNGVPIDNGTLWQLKQHWEDIQDQLIADMDRDYCACLI
jgi:DNA polymerase I